MTLLMALLMALLMGPPPPLPPMAWGYSVGPLCAGAARALLTVEVSQP